MSNEPIEDEDVLIREVIRTREQVKKIKDITALLFCVCLAAIVFAALVIFLS